MRTFDAKGTSHQYNLVNEDAFAQHEEFPIYAVSDGAGGLRNPDNVSAEYREALKGYEVADAAKLAVAISTREAAASMESEPARWAGKDTARGAMKDVLNDVERMVLFSLPKKDGERLRLNVATLDLVVLSDSFGTIGHIGDSKVYALQGGDIQQLTEDQAHSESLWLGKQFDSFQNNIKQFDLEGLDGIILATDGAEHSVDVLRNEFYNPGGASARDITQRIRERVAENPLDDTTVLVVKFGQRAEAAEQTANAQYAVLLESVALLKAEKVSWTGERGRLLAELRQVKEDGIANERQAAEARTGYKAELRTYQGTADVMRAENERLTARLHDLEAKVTSSESGTKVVSTDEALRAQNAQLQQRIEYLRALVAANILAGPVKKKPEEPKKPEKSYLRKWLQRTATGVAVVALTAYAVGLAGLWPAKPIPQPPAVQRQEVAQVQEVKKPLPTLDTLLQEQYYAAGTDNGIVTQVEWNKKPCWQSIRSWPGRVQEGMWYMPARTEAGNTAFTMYVDESSLQDIRTPLAMRLLFSDGSHAYARPGGEVKVPAASARSGKTEYQLVTQVGRDQEKVHLKVLASGTNLRIAMPHVDTTELLDLKQRFTDYLSTASLSTEMRDRYSGMVRAITASLESKV